MASSEDLTSVHATPLTAPVQETAATGLPEEPTIGETELRRHADDLAQRILNGLAQAGVHRALVNLKTWTLLKWLDEPCSFYDWRNNEADKPRVHPDDEHILNSMTKEFANGATSGVLRLPGNDTEWVPVHVTVNQVELEAETFAGLLSLRLPTDEEIVAAGLTSPTDDSS